MLLEKTRAKVRFTEGENRSNSDEEEKLFLRQSHDLDLQSTEQARNCMIEEQQKVKENPREYYGFSFDLQKALPYSKISIACLL